MKRSLSVVAFVPALLAFASAAAFAQSSFLKNGQYGLGLSGAYATNSGASGLSGTAGVGLGGIFDVSFSVGGVKYEPGSIEFSDLKATSMAPELRAHVIKQNSSRSPVSLSISVGYARDDFRSPDLEAAGLDMWADTVAVGGTIYRDIRLSRGAYLQPYAGLTYDATTVKFRNAQGLTLSSKDNLASFGVGLPLVYGVSDSAMLIFQPALTFNRNVTTFAISAGLVLRLSKLGP